MPWYVTGRFSGLTALDEFGFERRHGECTVQFTGVQIAAGRWSVHWPTEVGTYGHRLVDTAVGRPCWRQVVYQLQR